MDLNSKVDAHAYDVTACPVGELDEKTRGACLAIIQRGGAVDPEAARRELPRATTVVVARLGNEIVGVGTIKRVRPAYAATVATRSGEAFDPNTPELGYVAVDPKHQGKHLSSRIVAELLSHRSGLLFATTDNPRMKATLAKVGFVPKGREWVGGRSPLSLWIKS